MTPEGLKSAITAVEEANNLVADNIAYQCKVTHTLQSHLLSMKGSGLRNFPFISNFSDFPQLYSSPSRPLETDSLPQQHLLHSSCSNHGTSVSENHGKGYHSSSMNPTLMTARAEHSISHLLPALDHHLTHFETETNTLSPSSWKVSDDRFINSFSVQQSISSH